jgi:protein phosphatase
VTRHLKCFGFSDPGRSRTTNEDSFLVAAAAGLLAVADGVGGSAAGEVASALALGVLRLSVEDTTAVWPELLGGLSLKRAVEEAHHALLEAGRNDPGKAGMSTTLTAMLVLGDRAVIAHVDDSRAYLLRGRMLTQLTEDHSVVAACIRAGVMKAAQAKTCSFRNIIERAVGDARNFEVDTRLVGIERGDILLLTSDGLHSVVDDAEIAAVLLGEAEIDRATAQLVARANSAGGPDNITVVVARVA